MTELLSSAANAIAFVLTAKLGGALVGYSTWRARPRFPAAATGLLCLVAVCSIGQLAYPPLLHALDRQPAAIADHLQVWRLFTAALVQDGDVSAIVFNLASLAVLAALAEWHWGARRMLAVFTAAAVVLNVQAVLFDAAGAGSSGATYALGASLAGALIVTATGRRRLHALTCPLLGAAMLAAGNFHGLALLYGTVVGLVLQALCSNTRLGHATLRRSNDEHRILRPLDHVHA